jgi:tetratricopeptide (TPR) repeat protein
VKHKHWRPDGLSRDTRRQTYVPPQQPAVQATLNAALQCHQTGRLSEAERLYLQILSVQPRHPDCLHLLGMVAYQSGHHSLAAERISQAIAVKATVALYHSNLGNALTAQGRFDDAVASYRRAIRLKPDFPDSHYNLANVLKQQGRVDEAVACFRETIRLKPDLAAAHNNLGNLLWERGRLDEAIACCRRALELNPDFPEAHLNLGNALEEQGQFDAAVACFRRARALDPNIPEAHNNLGNVLQMQGKLKEAVACFRSALSLRPAFAEAHLNLGNALQQQGSLDAAIACFRRAIDLRPGYADGHFNLGIALLAQGDLAAGWQEYEWRWKTPHMMKVGQRFAQPQWQGEAAEGRTLLIYAEGGFGDTLQFCRYAPLAAARGLRVIVAVQKPLVGLLSRLPGVDRVHGFGEELPEFDLYCPMLSMPLALGTTLETIPSAASYLQADATQAASWGARLAGMDIQGLRVGLVWAGNPRLNAPRLAAVDLRRSLSPDRLAPLFGVPNVRFFSLQKDGPAAPGHFPLIDLMQDVGDFADTAALLANLDLVISVDTSVAHLAAALGKPVWVLDRFDPCWRWIAGRNDSPWYPTLRLYRQKQPGDWDGVLADVTKDLHRLAEPAPNLQTANSRMIA